MARPSCFDIGRSMTSRTQIVAIICSIVAAFFTEKVSGECSAAGVCVPGPVNAAKQVKNTITATSTCGNPPATYCRVKPLNQCFLCSNTTHTVDKMKDDSLSTSWQSVTWWEWYNNNNKTEEPLRVNVTLSFNKSYAITGEIRLVFKSPRPIEMILLKSDDKGQTWTPLQYYAEDCMKRFNVSNTPVESIALGNYGLHCTQDYSDLTPQENGEVLFDFLRRYSKSHFWNGTLQKYFTATDIRVQMLHPSTEGRENLNIKTEEIFNQYYYSIADLKVNARCQCHGHAQYCDYPNLEGKDCDCIHNTEGEDCERCKPLYNNKTWSAATSEDEPNPCEECECYRHADSCHYNESLGHGVCDDCYHNTTGLFCEKCVQKFYRNMSKNLKDPKVCLPCNCFMYGITNNGTCNQTTGQCECKQNVTGRQCDGCADTFWGFRLPPIGDCRECSCNGNGTRNGSLSCNQESGQCPCKNNIHQRTCSECKDGFFSFPAMVDSDCQQCDCDYGGSIMEICEKINGTCLCRSNIIGKRCKEVLEGYFVPSLVYLLYEAEDAMGSFVSTSYFTGANQEFTGTGYARIGLHQFISFTVTPNTIFSDFYIVIRYTNAEAANTTLQLSIMSCNSSDCNETYSITIEHLSHGVGLAWISSNTVSFNKAWIYHLNLTFVRGMYPNSTIEIDSLILLPNVKNVRTYDVAKDVGSVHGMAFEQIENCWTNSTTISGLQRSPDVCDNFTFSVMAEVFDGAVACSCNSTGTENGTTCAQLGGQCHCKPGVTGHSCDRCLPGFFNFSDNGCTACNCNQSGSSDLVCDPVTGQCPCRPGVITRTCSRCNPNYYGFHTGQGCVECKCNVNGSADLQCDSFSGVCPCKNSTTGTKCDSCRQNFFNFTSEGCQPCNCDAGGSSLLQCHNSTGLCTCKANAEGDKCERCKNGTYNSDPDNPDGCSPCFCFNRANECSSARGFVKSYIRANFTDNQHVNINKSPELTFSHQDQRLTINFLSGTFVTLNFNKAFSGFQLHSYGQLFKLITNNTNVESLKSDWNVTLKGKYNRQPQEAAFNLHSESSSSGVTYYARLHEHNSQQNLTAYQLQSILADIESVQVQGSFMTNGSLTVVIELVSATKDVGQEVDYVENCTCSNNYTDLSCGFCNTGYTRQKESSKPTSFKSCALCSCTGRSRECHPENGTCFNCRTGSEGDNCQRCQPGVDNTTDCTRCIPGYFGLTPSSGGCGECDCVLPNTMYGNSSVCNETTGQCTCKPRIGGRQCDRCHENAYNTSRGCVDCPECYRLISVEVNKLRKSSADLEDAIERLRNGNIGDATFATRLDNAKKTTNELVSGAKEAQEIERNLTKEIMQLNETLNQLENVLLEDVSPGAAQLSSNLSSVAADRNTIEQVIQLIREAVYHSNNVINMSVDPSVREAEAISDYLTDLVPRFSAISSNFTAAATRQNDTAYEIQGKVDSAEALITEAQQVMVNASSMQNNLESSEASIEHLQMRVDVIKALGDSLNTSGYQLYWNASASLLRANQTLSEVMLLDPNNTDTVRQIARETQEAGKQAQMVISRAQNLTQELYSNLTFQVDFTLKQLDVLMSLVNNAEQRGMAVLEEARRARQEALDAVQLASKTFTDAQEMLQILRNFEAKSQEASQFAESSLQRAIEANATSWNAIEYAQGVNASLQATLAVARRALNLAQQAWNISFNENQGVSIIHADANRLSHDASTSKYTAEYFTAVEQNVTSVNSSSQGIISACRQNYSTTASEALSTAYTAKSEADKADVAAKNLKVNVDGVVKEASMLQQVNTTRLSELKNEIQRIRAEFTQRNVTDLIKELKNAKEEQQKFLTEYREKVKEKREEITELKALYASLTSVTCEKSTT